MKMNKKLSIGVVATCMLVGSSLAFADSLRCQSKLIRTGAIKQKVLRSCGEPASKEVVKEIVHKQFDNGFHKTATEEITSYSEWVYDKGRHFYVLTFKGSRLDKIERQRY